MFKFFKSIYNKIHPEPNSNDRNFFNSNLNVDRRQFFFGEIFKNIKKYKIISLLINDETSTKRTESMSIRSNYKNAYDSNSGLGLGEALVNSKDYHELLKEFNELKILCEVHHFLVLRNHTGVLYWPPEPGLAGLHTTWQISYHLDILGTLHGHKSLIIS